MKWKLLAYLEKALLFIVGVKPVRGILDRALGNKRFIRLMKNKRFWSILAVVQVVALIITAWIHDPLAIVLGMFSLVSELLAIHRKDNEPRDDDNQEKPDDPTPYGDVVDSWLRSQQPVLS